MTDAEKRRSEELAAWEYWESLPKQPTPLNAEMVESGEISVECGYEDEEIKVSVLTLGPHAAIRSHKHSSDEEEYYNLDTFESPEVLHVPGLPCLLLFPAFFLPYFPSSCLFESIYLFLLTSFFFCCILCMSCAGINRGRTGRQKRGRNRL